MRPRIGKVGAVTSLAATVLLIGCQQTTSTQPLSAPTNPAPYSPAHSESAPSGTPSSPAPNNQQHSKSSAQGSGGNQPCPSPPLRGVYHSYRLHVLATCQTYRGIVLFVRHEDDGDYHVVVKPDAGYSKFLNQDNYRYESGGLVTEIMPRQHFPQPAVGEHVAIFGTWVLDAYHGWQEIHPIWSITNLANGQRTFSLPVVPPTYDSGESGASGSSSGSGGGGGCSAADGYYTSSYPTATLIYPANNPDWHDLSTSYLRHFCTLAAAEAAYPGRSVDTDG